MEIGHVDAHGSFLRAHNGLAFTTPTTSGSDHAANLKSLYNQEAIESTLKVSRRSRALRECLVGGHEELGTMTTKEKAISVIQSLDDNATLDEVIDRLYLLRKIELGIAQADAGDVMDHEEFMAELELEDG